MDEEGIRLEKANQELKQRLVYHINLNKEILDSNRELREDNQQLRILVDSLKTQNKKLKGRLNDLGVEYY